MGYESIIKNIYIYINPLQTVYLRFHTNTHGNNVQVE